MLSTIVFGVIASATAIIFFAVPIVKLAPKLGFKVIPLIVVVLIGVAMMIYEFAETIRDSKKDAGG